MKNFFSKSYKELFVFSFIFALAFAILEIIGLYIPNDANSFDLYRALRLSLFMIIGTVFILVCVVISFFRLKKQGSKAIFYVLFAIDIILNLLVLSNALVFMIKTAKITGGLFTT